MWTEVCLLSHHTFSLCSLPVKNTDSLTTQNSSKWKAGNTTRTKRMQPKLIEKKSQEVNFVNDISLSK